MNIVTCGADNDFLNSVIRGIILEMINEGTLQAQLLDCEGTPLGKNAKVLLCCEGDCDGGGEHKDTFVDKVTKEIEGGNYKITLSRNDGQSFVIEIPVAPAPAPAPAEDKYVTDFSLANRGGKPVLELRRSDNVVLTANLPDNPGGGGGGGTVKSVEMEEAPEAHGEGGGSDGYYYSRRQSLVVTNSDDSIVSDELPLNRVYWHGSKELDDRNYRDGEERRPLVDVIVDKAMKDAGARVVRIPFGLVGDNAKQNIKLLEIPFDTFPSPNDFGGGNGGQGGGGANDYVSSGKLAITKDTDYHANLELSRLAGGKVNINMDDLLNTARNNPRFNPVIEVTAGNNSQTTSDGVFITAPQVLSWAKDFNSDKKTVELPQPTLLFDTSGSGNKATATRLLPVMDIWFGAPKGRTARESWEREGSKPYLWYVDAAGNQAGREVKLTGGAVGGVTDITLSPSMYRTLSVTANGQDTSLQLPDTWFERKSAGSTTDANVKNFVTVEEYNVLAANLAQLSWSTAIPHESFRLPPGMLADFRVELLPALHNQYGQPVGGIRAVDRSDWIKLHGNNVLVYPYQIISLFQPGDTRGYEATHLHRLHPYLHALIPSRDRDGAGPGTLNGTHAIDIFRQAHGVGLTGLQYVYAGTVYMSTVFMDDPAQEPPPGVYHSVFPINILNTTPMDKVANYSSIMPEIFWYRVRDLFNEETPTTVPSELIYNTYYNVKSHNSIPHTY